MKQAAARKRNGFLPVSTHASWRSKRDLSKFSAAGNSSDGFECPSSSLDFVVLPLPPLRLRAQGRSGRHKSTGTQLSRESADMITCDRTHFPSCPRSTHSRLARPRNMQAQKTKIEKRVPPRNGEIRHLTPTLTPIPSLTDSPRPTVQAFGASLHQALQHHAQTLHLLVGAARNPRRSSGGGGASSPAPLRAPRPPDAAAAIVCRAVSGPGRASAH